MSDAVNPAASFGQWFNVGQGLGGAAQAPARQEAYKQQQEALAAQQRAMDEARAKALAPGATAKDRQGWVMLYAPEQAKQLTEAFAGMDKASADEMNLGSGEVVSMVRAGNIDLAKDALERRAIVAESSGDEQAAKFARSMAQTLDVDPKVVENYFLDMMSFSPGGDKVIETLNKKGEEGRNVELHPYDIAKIDAETKKLMAEEKKILFEMEMARLKANNPSLELPDGMRNRQGIAVDKALSTGLTADQATSLADRISSMPRKSGGFLDTASDLYKKTFGSQDALSLIKAEFNELSMKKVLEGLPPGPATDRDIEIAMRASLPDTANVETMSSYLRGIAKIARYKSSLAKAEADWIANVGSMTTASREFEIDGKKVSPGTSFVDFVKANIELGDTATSKPGSGQSQEGNGKGPVKTVKVKPGEVLEGDD